jgi:hypothetical protein
MCSCLRQSINANAEEDAYRRNPKPLRFMGLTSPMRTLTQEVMRHFLKGLKYLS